MHIIPRTTAALATFAIASLAGHATATVHERQEVILTTENCQPSLPAFDGSIRKRPLAMQNEGTTPAFVTCAFIGVFNALPSQKTIGISLANAASSPRTVSCTLVDGRAHLANAIQIVKQVSVPAGGNADLLWAAGDNGGTAFIYPALSCSLPPAVGIRHTYRTYDEYVGG